MSDKKPVKMSDADLKFFEEMLVEKRRQLVTAQSESERAHAFQGQKSQTSDGGESDSADSATDYNTLATPYSLADRDQVRELQGRDQEEGTGKQPHGNGAPLCRSTAQGNAEEGRRPLATHECHPRRLC